MILACLSIALLASLGCRRHMVSNRVRERPTVLEPNAIACNALLVAIGGATIHVGLVCRCSLEFHSSPEPQSVGGPKTMFHQGARAAGGNATAEVEAKISLLLDQFIKEVAAMVSSAGIQRGMVRSMLPCSIVTVIDALHLSVAAQKSMGVPSTLTLSKPTEQFTAQKVYSAAKWEFGFDLPFVVQFPVELLDAGPESRQAAVQAIAGEHFRSEIARVEREMNLVQVNPVFGPVSYTVDPKLAFVLMPFSEQLTEIYSSLVKPAIEQSGFDLVCRRADDIKSNRSIVQDIWKSICEARLIIADLSGLNPNVMYELGIAHTIGKDTVLIYQRGENVKFPFDLAHIR